MSEQVTDVAPKEQVTDVAPKKPALDRKPSDITDTTRFETHPNVVREKFKKGCFGKAEFFMFNQSIAVVRHADRLDHTEEWLKYEEQEAYPNDTPLTSIGFDHAREVGDKMASHAKENEKKWSLIVASPYYRCAQTASCIAEKINCPVHFDLDLGEVFDEVSMVGDCNDKPQHRPANVLSDKLTKEFPEVQYIRNPDGTLAIEGRLQQWPEPFDGARMRYCYKIKKLVQQAASELYSVVIVTHGDAVAACLGMLKETWLIKEIPYTAWFIGDRKVKVLQKGKKQILKEEPVYVHPEQWTLALHPKLTHVEVNPKSVKKAHEHHEKEMAEMNAKANTMKTTYNLHPDSKHIAVKTLDHMQAHAKDTKFLMKKAGTAAFGQDRVKCGPKHDERVEAQNELS